MPKATSPAAVAATTETPVAEAPTAPAETTAPDPTPPPAEEAEHLPEWGNWRYTGHAGRTYTNVPVTPEPGDVIRYYGPPAPDGLWELTDDQVTRHPDNHRSEPEPATPAGGAAPALKEG